MERLEWLLVMKFHTDLMIKVRTFPICRLEIFPLCYIVFLSGETNTLGIVFQNGAKKIFFEILSTLARYGGS